LFPVVLVQVRVNVLVGKSQASCKRLWHVTGLQGAPHVSQRLMSLLGQLIGIEPCLRPKQLTQYHDGIGHSLLQEQNQDVVQP